MKNIVEYLKKIWKIFIAAREASAVAEASRYVSNAKHLQELQDQQRQLIMMNFLHHQR